MKCAEITDALIECLKSGKYKYLRVNFPNGDMVGHTGSFLATECSMEALDLQLARILKVVDELHGAAIITADHGNAEKLVDTDGSPFTAHTTNPVPFVLVNYDEAYTLREGGCLADIVPTLIEMMGMEQPKEMTGKSLLIKK